jgi:molybdate transport system substrate-binding protein
MRAFCLALLFAGVSTLAAQAAEIRVITPGVIGNSGLRETAADFTKATGVNVIIVSSGMGQIINDIKTGTPPADIVMLPMELAGSLALEGGLKKGTLTALGRVEMGLFAKPGAPHPDISTAEKLAAAMKSASVVFYSDPKSGSMQAGMSGKLMEQPENAGVHGMPVKGDAEPALRRGDGDLNAMGLGLIHGVHPRDGKPTDNPYLVGPLPAELAMHMDMMTAVSVRSADEKDARAFVQFITQPSETSAWKLKGTDRYDQ